MVFVCFSHGNSELIEFASNASGSWGCLYVSVAAGSSGTPYSLSGVGGSHGRLRGMGQAVKSHMVMCKCNISAAVQVIKAWSCHYRGLMYLLRCLCFLEATFQFQLTACHLPGMHDTLVDLLSRNILPHFYSKVPNANREPTPISHQLVLLLLAREGNWTSPTWTH